MQNMQIQIRGSGRITVVNFFHVKICLPSLLWVMSVFVMICLLLFINFNMYRDLVKGNKLCYAFDEE